MWDHVEQMIHVVFDAEIETPPPVNASLSDVAGFVVLLGSERGVPKVLVASNVSSFGVPPGEASEPLPSPRRTVRRRARPSHPRALRRGVSRSPLDP